MTSEEMAGFLMNPRPLGNIISQTLSVSLVGGWVKIFRYWKVWLMEPAGASQSLFGSRNACSPAKYPPKPANKATTTATNNTVEVFHERDRNLYFSSCLLSSSPTSMYPVCLNEGRKFMFEIVLGWRWTDTDLEWGKIGSLASWRNF